MRDLHELTPLELGVALMQGDEATLQVGYSPANAALAVADIHGLTTTETAQLQTMLESKLIAEFNRDIEDVPTYTDRPYNDETTGEDDRR